MPLEASDIKYVTPEEADRNCPTMRGYTGTECPGCKRRVIIHCVRCEQIVTRCSCTFKEMVKQHLEANAQQQEMDESLRKQGVWLPNGN